MASPSLPTAPRLSLVLPAFDERERLPGALPVVAEFVRTYPEPVEVLLVDDGSRDGTAELAASLARELALPLRVLRSERNLGKGAAVRRGMLEARGDVALFTDVDLAVPLTHVGRFVERVRGGADVVIGSRQVPGSEIRVHQPWLREKLGTWFRNLARTLLVPGISDFTCGFKAFRREAAQRVFALQRIPGWGFDVEILLIAHRLGLRIEEEAVVWSDDHRTRVRLVRDVARSAWELARIRWNDVRGRYGEPRTPRSA